MNTMIEFDTTTFEYSHGKLPRGYGSWAFSEERGCPVETAMWAPTSTYADAKKWARAKIVAKYGKQARGTLYVCS